jgi:hypothetical protein
MPDAKLFTRLSININQETEEVLQKHKKERGISITETVRRAVALLDMVERESADGSKVQIVDRDGYVREILLLT